MTLAQVISCKFCEISKNTFFTERLQTTSFFEDPDSAKLLYLLGKPQSFYSLNAILTKNLKNCYLFAFGWSLSLTIWLYKAKQNFASVFIYQWSLEAFYKLAQFILEINLLLVLFSDWCPLKGHTCIIKP